MKKLRLRNRPKVGRIAATFCGMLVAALGCFLPLGSQAEVHVVRCDPPVSVAAFANPAPGLDWATTAFDFDLDGVPDFRLTYGDGVMMAYFNFPTAFAAKVPPPTPPGITVPILVGVPGTICAVPLESVIGSNIVSSVKTNFYAWSQGFTNGNYFPELLGDHEANVIVANLAIPTQPGPQQIITISTNGFVTNIYYPSLPLALGDIAGKEGVIALQFYLGSERHYGYVHFDLDQGAAGVIYGWAYETEPDVPIKAVPLLPGEKITKHKLLVNPFGDTPKHGRVVSPARP